MFDLELACLLAHIWDRWSAWDPYCRRFLQCRGVHLPFCLVVLLLCLISSTLDFKNIHKPVGGDSGIA